jgi:hypothetical protein
MKFQGQGVRILSSGILPFGIWIIPVSVAERCPIVVEAADVDNLASLIGDDNRFASLGMNITRGWLSPVRVWIDPLFDPLTMVVSFLNLVGRPVSRLLCDMPRKGVQDWGYPGPRPR